jgi:hypothetical protein
LIFLSRPFSLCRKVYPDSFVGASDCANIGQTQRNHRLSADAFGADALRAVVNATGYRMLDAACFLP